MAIFAGTVVALVYFSGCHYVIFCGMGDGIKVHERLIMFAILLAFLVWLFATGKYSDWVKLTFSDQGAGA